MTKVLVPTHNHAYREANLTEQVQVVYNKKYNSYSEYFGEDYLQEGDVVLLRTIVE
jgi:hypothetical protein